MQELGFKENDEIIITLGRDAYVDPKYIIQADSMYFRKAQGRFLKFSAYGVLFNPKKQGYTNHDTKYVYHILWKDISEIEKVY